jgi:HD-GYP domain-containing protein (c-di-GMP phosphodiesterase class II)
MSSASARDTHFTPIHIDSIDSSTLAMDVWVQLPGQRSPTLFRAAGLAVQPTELAKLREQRVERVYIPTPQHGAYRHHLRGLLDRTLTDAALSHAERGRLIRVGMAAMLEDALGLPGRGEPLDTIADIALSLAAWNVSHPKEFAHLLDLSAHEFRTSLHMVNVGVGCTLLFRQLRPDDTRTAAMVAHGGLLHDIGKRDIPNSLLIREGPLADQDFAVVRAHPMTGFEELSKRQGMPPIVLEMVLDHHERSDGKGFPNGKRSDQIGFFARICAVVDTFDSMIAARSHRAPIHPADALDIMGQGAGTHFDPDVLTAWKRVVGDMLTQDPERGRGAARCTTPIALPRLLPRAASIPSDTPTSSAGAGTGVAERQTKSGADRRVFPRKACELQIYMKFTHQSREYPILVGQRIAVMMQDISRGGVGIFATFPFAKGDEVQLEIPTFNAKPLERYARVVSVRSEMGRWRMGLQFLDRT